MRKRKLRIRCVVENNLGLYWFGKKKGWQKWGSGQCCSCRHFHKTAAAFKHMNNMGHGFYLIQMSPHSGRNKGWRFKTFVFNEKYTDLKTTK